MKKKINDKINSLKERYRLKNIYLYKGKFKDTDIWFIDERVELPEDCGLYKYEVRHDNGDPVEVSDNVIIDFYGTILSKEIIDLPVEIFSYFIFDDIEDGDFYVYYNEPVVTLYELIKQVKEKKCS